VKPGLLVVLLAVALGVALWALWDMRGRVDTSQVTIDALEAEGRAYRDSAAAYRAQVDSLTNEITDLSVADGDARRRFQVHETMVGPVAVLEGDSVPQAIPLAVAQALRACDSIVPACQLGLQKAHTALLFENRRAEAAESALVVWENRPPKKPKFGFQAGLLVGLGLSIAAALAFN